MEKKRQKFFSAKNVAFFAVLLALVIVLQIWGGTLKILATSLSFVLVPIVLGGMLLGPLAGACLGFAFGLIVLIYGLTGADGFTAILLQDHFVLTILLCLIKGTAAGFVSGLLYKVIANKNSLAASFVASAAAPIVNTGLFIIGALLMSDTLSANFVADGQTVIYYLIIVCAGTNFLVELIINLILAPTINTIVKVVEKSIKKKG